MHLSNSSTRSLLRHLAIALILLFAVDGYSEESRSSKPGRSSRTEVKAQMRKAEFFGRLRIELRKQLCQEGGLTDCFNVTKQSCEQFVTDRFDSCAKQHKVSGKDSGMVSLVGEDLVIAESASKCISENFGRKFKSKLKESEECRTLQ